MLASFVLVLVQEVCQRLASACVAALLSRLSGGIGFVPSTDGWVTLGLSRPLVLAWRPRHSYSGVRAGEAKQPGPSPPPTRRRILVKSPRPRSLPPTPVSEAPATLVDSTQGEAEAPEEEGLEEAPLHALLKLYVRRVGQAKSVLLGCAKIRSKGAWRWQIRSQPPLAGTDSATPGEALRLFLRTHAGKIDESSIERIQEHISSLEARAPAFKALMRRALTAQLAQPVVMSNCILPPTDLSCASQPLTWQDIACLQASRIPCLRHIPHACVGAFVSLVRDLLCNVSFPEDAPSPACLLLVLPKLILPSLASSSLGQKAPPKARIVETQSRIAQARRGEWRTLMNSALQCVAPMRVLDSPEVSEEDTAALPLHVAEEVIRRIKKGSSVKVWSLTQSDGIAPWTPENLKAAEHKLCPSGATSTGMPYMEDLDSLDAFGRRLGAVLGSIETGKSLG